MNIKTNKCQTPRWLTEELQIKVRKVFEPKYERTLSDTEVISIAENLTMFMEHFFKFRYRMEHKDEK